MASFSLNFFVCRLSPVWPWPWPWLWPYEDEEDEEVNHEPSLALVLARAARPLLRSVQWLANRVLGQGPAVQASIRGRGLLGWPSIGAQTQPVKQICFVSFGGGSLGGRGEKMLEGA